MHQSLLVASLCVSMMKLEQWLNVLDILANIPVFKFHVISILFSPFFPFFPFFLCFFFHTEENWIFIPLLMMKILLSSLWVYMKTNTYFQHSSNCWLYNTINYSISNCLFAYFYFSNCQAVECSSVECMCASVLVEYCCSSTTRVLCEFQHGSPRYYCVWSRERIIVWSKKKKKKNLCYSAQVFSSFLFNLQKWGKSEWVCVNRRN